MSFPQFSSKVHVRDSIVTKLLKVVFSIYFSITVIITSIHLVAEYNHTQNSVLQELEVIQQTFQASLSKSLWDMNLEQLKPIFQGMVKFPSVIGVKIENEKGLIIGSGGMIINDQGQTVLINDQQEPTITPLKLDKLFTHSFPLLFHRTNEIRRVGTATLYSSHKAVFDRVRYGFSFILVNAVIKTIALGIIFIVVGRILLSRPLSALTAATEQIELDNLENVNIRVNTNDNNELKILEQAFTNMTQKLLASRQQLEMLNQELERKVKERTQQLETSLGEVEHQNTLLLATNHKLEEFNNTKQELLNRLRSISEKNLYTLRTTVQKLENSLLDLVDKGTFTLVKNQIAEIETMMEPIASLYVSEQAIRNKRVLLAETDKKQQIIAKLALGGTGVDLDIAATREDTLHLVNTNTYDVICLDHDFLDIGVQIHASHPDVIFVFMTSLPVPQYISILQRYPYLSNIVSKNMQDRTFTLKNIITTISKLLNRDLFGLEKYMNWGVDVQVFPVKSSRERQGLVDRMDEEFRNLGIRSSIRTKCTMIAEELLMNAVYDAPTNSNGKPKYNHMERTTHIDLEKQEQGTFRYACDGMLLGVSVEDPFGALTRDTILAYLRACYDSHGQESLNLSGGAGRGLFQIMEACDLLVINVKERVKTEVIALLNVDPSQKKSSQHDKSFHFFQG